MIYWSESQCAIRDADTYNASFYTSVYFRLYGKVRTEPNPDDRNFRIIECLIILYLKVYALMAQIKRPVPTYIFFDCIYNVFAYKHVCVYKHSVCNLGTTCL